MEILPDQCYERRMGPCFPELFFIDGINLKEAHHVGIDQTHGELRIHGEADA